MVRRLEISGYGMNTMVMVRAAGRGGGGIESHLMMSPMSYCRINVFTGTTGVPDGSCDTATTASRGASRLADSAADGDGSP